MSQPNQTDQLFTPAALKEMFPADRADRFFDALYGDASDGAYDIELIYKGQNANNLSFELLLKERPGKCLACNLTYGLPQVFTRHPVINLKGVAQAVAAKLQLDPGQVSWQLGQTRTVSKELHAVPFTVSLP